MPLRHVAKVLVAGLLLTTSACGSSSSGSCTDGKSCTRILFLGNSYTFVNDLPAMLTDMAGHGGHGIDYQTIATGGESLQQHLASNSDLQAINSGHWDYVVLQEQSQIPSVENSRETEMYPAVRGLVDSIRASGAKPMLFLTWAHRDGWPENGLADYDTMQSGITDGYETIAQQLGVTVAPVGVTWQKAEKADYFRGLWQDDGSHPTVTGTYLAACVFYATFFKQDPPAASVDGVADDVGAALRGLAHDVVLTDKMRWNIS